MAVKLMRNIFYHEILDHQYYGILLSIDADASFVIFYSKCYNFRPM